MRCFVVVGFYLVAVVSATTNVSTNYHIDIGIPVATRIKEAEDKLLANQNTLSRRIVGGVVESHAYPFLAGLIATFFNFPKNSVCGSSLVSANRLVTAAHCWHSSEPLFVRQFTVVLGSQFLFRGGTRILTSHVVVHPKYNAKFDTNDIAVIYLPYPVTFSNIIHPIALPRYNLWDSFVGEITTAIGYGKSNDAQTSVPKNTVVRHVNLRVIPVEECKKSFESNYVQASNICTDGFGGVGLCGGDSGGPLVTNRNGQNILIGVSSFVAKDGCQLGYPSVFTRVTSYYNFILHNM